MKDIIIIYHGDCPDGFGGAWAAWKKFGDRAEYVSIGLGLPPSKELINKKEIYMIDFVYPEDYLKKLLAENERVIAIDHHKTNEKHIRLAHEHFFDIGHSGSVLAWKYFHPDKAVPKMLEYIEDRDLWKFRFAETMAICYFIDSFDFDFRRWSKLVEDLENKKKKDNYVILGNTIVGYQNKIIDRIIEENVKLVKFEGYEIYAINANHLLASQIGSVLYGKKPPMAVIWSEDKDSVSVSLRSDGTIDVGKIAEKYSGGGHRASAGFRLPTITSFPWKEVKIYLIDPISS